MQCEKKNGRQMPRPSSEDKEERTSGLTGESREVGEKKIPGQEECGVESGFQRSSISRHQLQSAQIERRGEIH